MNDGLTLITAPASEPLDLDTAKLFLRVGHDDEDELVESLITRARERVEELSGLALLTQTWEEAFEAFPCATSENPWGGFILRKPPLQSVTSITYIDTNGASQVLAGTEYTVNTRAFPGQIVPAYGKSWPGTRDVPNAVVVKFVAGEASVLNLHGDLLDAMKLLLGDRYLHREETITGMVAERLQVVRSLLANHRAYVV